MSQYKHKPNTENNLEGKQSARTPNLQKEITSLKETVNQQQAAIENLTRTVRKLQNEVRVAVNAFNLKRNG